MTTGTQKSPPERKTLLTRLSETAVLLAAAGGLYWSGQMASRLAAIEKELHELPGVATNVLLLCRALPEVQCVGSSPPREEHAQVQSPSIRRP